MKVAILSNVNLDILVRFLKNGGREFDYEFKDSYIGGFNQYAQEMIDEKSGLYKFSPDIVLLHLEGTALFEDVFFNQFSYNQVKLEATVKERANELWQLAEIFSQRNPQCLLFLNTITMRPYTIGGALETNSDSLSMRQFCHLFNGELINKKMTGALSSVFLADWERVISFQGISSVYDDRYWYLGRVPYNNNGFEKLSETYFCLLNSVKGKTKKVIVLDLDNTLWGGIIGEDGLENIKLSEDGIGKAYRDFQKLIRSVKNKGILLAVVSKNNLDDAREVFEKHPLMVLKEDDFVSLRINWLDKAQNVSDIANELNLGLQSFVFIDDNPVERERVKGVLPEVTVPDFPEDPAYLMQWFSEIVEKYFNKISITKEDRERTLMYQAEGERKKIESKSGSIEEFLSNLDMRAIIYENHREMLNRLAQLTQRTNQFNLRTQRYTENEVLSFMESKDYHVLDLELIDKFGTNGIVGLIIVKLNPAKGEGFIDTFLMSCRIIGRGAEKTFLNHLIFLLKKKGIRRLVGEYIPTKKNRLVKNLYNQLGFVNMDEGGERNIWTLDIVNFDPCFPDYMEVLVK